MRVAAAAYHDTPLMLHDAAMMLMPLRYCSLRFFDAFTPLFRLCR